MRKNINERWINNGQFRYCWWYWLSGVRWLSIVGWGWKSSKNKSSRSKGWGDNVKNNKNNSGRDWGSNSKNSRDKENKHRHKRRTIIMTNKNHSSTKPPKSTSQIL